MSKELNQFLNDETTKKFFVYVSDYKPETFIVIQDSEFTRKSIARRYKGRFNISSCNIEKVNYSFVCRFDQTNEVYQPKELIKKIKKPLIITGLGLYGEIFIKEIRLFEKINNVPENSRIPIIIYGSPKQEKLDRISNLFDIFIDNTTTDSLMKLDLTFSMVI